VKAVSLPLCVDFESASLLALVRDFDPFFAIVESCKFSQGQLTLSDNVIALETLPIEYNDLYGRLRFFIIYCNRKLFVFPIWLLTAAGDDF